MPSLKLVITGLCESLFSVDCFGKRLSASAFAISLPGR
ncbi:hypothetical protein T06_11051 [Trichinella sp. T6]|nr:hypothetical protein T06_11051 [Trichinella sp. T6]